MRSAHLAEQQQNRLQNMKKKNEEKEIRQIIYNFFAAFNFFSLLPNMEDKLSLSHSLSSVRSAGYKKVISFRI